MANSNMEKMAEEILVHSNTLLDDVDISITQLNNAGENYEYYARSYIRAYAAWIEGSIWIYKEIIRKAEHQWHKKLALSSQLFLFEYDWTIEHSGQPKIKQKKIRTR